MQGDDDGDIVALPAYLLTYSPAYYLPTGWQKEEEGKEGKTDPYCIL
jgi:hypothetical protein